MSLPLTKSPLYGSNPRDGEREVVMARWGLIPFWMKEKPKVPHINARAETVHKLPLFPCRGFCFELEDRRREHLGNGA